MGLIIRGSASYLPIASESIDLCYADPPFFSQRNYKQFDDRWKSLDDYLAEMEIAVREMHRVLKSTGSFYLHCDWHASHYLKVMCDKIFGYGNFQNEVVWCYRGGGVPKDAFARKHDIILRYSKTDEFTFHQQYVPYSAASEKLVKARGGTSIDGKERNLERGATMPDWWEDMNSLQTWSPERVGYPTQKPLALLDRIIKASSNPGDIVLDPFCGGGTTLLAAARNKRRYIGIDINPEAIRISNQRLSHVVKEETFRVAEEE